MAHTRFIHETYHKLQQINIELLFNPQFHLKPLRAMKHHKLTFLIRLTSLCSEDKGPTSLSVVL